MPRTSPDEARELLLNAGVEEFRRNVQGRRADDVLAGLGLEQIAARAGYRSVGMIYNLWRNDETPARSAFFADLLERIAYSYTSVEVELKSTPAADLPSTTRSVAMETIRFWSGEGHERHVAGRLLTASAHIPAVREALQSTARKTIEEATDLLEVALTHFGFRMRPPLEAIDLAVALRALMLGFLDMAEIHPRELAGFPDQTFAWRDSAGWNTFAVASLGIMMEMIEPIPTREGK
jgi:hypothetical protein